MSQIYERRHHVLQSSAPSFLLSVLFSSDVDFVYQKDAINDRSDLLFRRACRSFAFASRLRFCAGAIHITSHAHMHHYAVPRCSCMGIHPPPPPPVVSPSRGGEGAPSARMAAEISHVNFCFCCCTFAFFCIPALQPARREAQQ